MKVCLDQQIDRRKILKKAVIKAADILGLTDDEFLKILKIKRSTIVQLKNDNFLESNLLDEELAILFVSIFYLLHELSGGDVDWIRHFMRSYNKLIGTSPLKQIQNLDGLVKLYKLLGTLSTNTL